MIKIGPALMENVELLERERGIPRDVTISSLKEAMLAAYKRYAKLLVTDGYECRLIEKSGEISIYKMQEVVKKLDEEKDPDIQILLKDARKIRPDAEVGEFIETEVTPEEFGRIAAQSAKQVITQRIREAEKMLILREFEEKQGQVTTGIVQRIEGRNVIINIGKSEAILPPREQLPGEYYRVGNKLRVYVASLRDNGRVPQIIVSQAHPSMVREVFELEVPEIEDGIIEIKNIAREAGFRTKVAVSSNDPEVDPQGACIGSRGSRIQAIVNELKNEKIDIIRWSDDPMQFITNALAPAKIIRVDLLEEQPPRAIVVVPDDQLSLAIGREGQNVRLAAKLTGFKLDIKSYSQLAAAQPEQEYYEESDEDAFSPEAEGRAPEAWETDDAPAPEAAPVAEDAQEDSQQEEPASPEATEEAEEESGEEPSEVVAEAVEPEEESVAEGDLEEEPVQ